MPTLDPRVPVTFLETAYRPEDWVAVFLKSYETGATAQRVGPLSMVVDARFQAWLRWRNRDRWNVYVSVNAITAGRRSRRREAVGTIRHVFLDADRDGDGVLSAISARRDLPVPSYVLRTSPGRVHILWKVTAFTTDIVEAVQKALAAELGTDPAATPCTQTTRLPGFVNHKRQPFLVTAAYRDVEHVFTPADFPVPRGAMRPACVVWRDINCNARHRLGRSSDRTNHACQYLTAIPPAVTGQHGDLHTFRTCCRLARGFALSDDEAMVAVREWNERCSPPWTEGELRDKLRRARLYGREPVGGLLAPVTTSSRHRASCRRRPKE
jgi:hypothetical protein